MCAHTHHLGIIGSGLEILRNFVDYSYLTSYHNNYPVANYRLKRGPQYI